MQHGCLLARLLCTVVGSGYCSGLHFVHVHCTGLACISALLQHLLRPPPRHTRVHCTCTKTNNLSVVSSSQLVIPFTNIQMSSQGITARFDTSAYAKILLHGAKHSTAPVIGLLMGTRNGSEVSEERLFTNSRVIQRSHAFKNIFSYSVMGC